MVMTVGDAFRATIVLLWDDEELGSPQRLRVHLGNLAGGVFPSQLRWSPPFAWADGGAEAGRFYERQLRRVDGRTPTAWTSIAVQTGNPPVPISFPDESVWEIRVRAVNGLGVRSAWSVLLLRVDEEGGRLRLRDGAHLRYISLDGRRLRVA